MIIRVLGIGQFRLDDQQLDSLNRVDNKIVEHVSKGNQKEFRNDLAKLISIIKDKGAPLDPSELVPSDIIVPPGDMSYAEAKTIFSDPGLIKD
jgi:hypothetical protein